MGCKCAPACRKALDDATARWPARSRASDGCCGDAAHAARKSDHNPDASGYAHAFDITHDPTNGVDCHELSQRVINDPRITYVIWIGRIYKARTKQWEIYRGPNKHNHHMHVSIKAEARDDLHPWPWSVDSGVVYVTLRLNDRGAAVRSLQEKLNIEADGIFGYGTDRAVKNFQEAHGLEANGIVGPETWEALNK